MRVNGNFLDIGILEWCKLFVDLRGQHHWETVVSDPPECKRMLLQHLGISQIELNTYVAEVRVYRNKFVAHLDSELVADIPRLDVALGSAQFLLEYLHANEDEGGFFVGLPSDANRLFTRTRADARTHSKCERQR
jgi:hypothetical protein